MDFNIEHPIIWPRARVKIRIRFYASIRLKSSDMVATDRVNAGKASSY